MRCPKCQYLGFEGQGRCRNCGYDLSLSTTLPESEPSITLDTVGSREVAGEAATEDLPLRAEPTARERAREAIRQRAAAVRTPSSDSFDLPLFAGATEPRAPSPTPSPRAPLSVRRASIEPPRPRPGLAAAPGVADPPSIEPSAPVAEPNLAADAPPDTSFHAATDVADVTLVNTPRDDAPGLTLSFDTPLVRRPPVISQPEPRTPRVDSPSVASTLTRVEATADAAAVDDATTARLAPLGARVFGGLVDIAVLGAVDAIVLAFTLQLTGLSWAQIDRLPPAPMLAFLMLLATGYLSMFTLLAGQTAGQMLAGIRVVETGGAPVRFGHAVLRAVVQVVTVPLAGIGFLPALLGADRRALYDRLSDTEVVRRDI